MFVSILSLAVLVFVRAFASQVGHGGEPELLITAHFPEDNPFHHVMNGEKNTLYLLVENKSEQNATVKTIAGSFHDPDSEKLVKNISTLTYGVISIAGSKFTIPYSFHSELRPGDYSLHVWVDHTVEGSSYRVVAYEGIVKVVEPELSIFDFKLLSTYAITGIVIAAGVYFVALSLFPSLSKPKKKRAKMVDVNTTAQAGTHKAGGVGYQEEWIPEHHLPKSTGRRGQKKVNSEGVASSGDEKVTSGPESGVEGPQRPRRGKKA